MSENEKCPKCGAEVMGTCGGHINYACGTFTFPRRNGGRRHVERSERCRSVATSEDQS